MATKGKQIPCRVCGKLFEPCAFCQSHSDVFRWRNFACSLECANKYIAETMKFREQEASKAKKEANAEVKEKPIEKKGTITNTSSKKSFGKKNLFNDKKDDSEKTE